MASHRFCCVVSLPIHVLASIVFELINHNVDVEAPISNWLFSHYLLKKENHCNERNVLSLHWGRRDAYMFL